MLSVAGYIRGVLAVRLSFNINDLFPTPTTLSDLPDVEVLIDANESC